MKNKSTARQNPWLSLTSTSFELVPTSWGKMPCTSILGIAGVSFLQEWGRRLSSVDQVHVRTMLKQTSR